MLEHILSNAEETRGHGNVVHQENAEGTVDGEKEKPRIDADGGYLQEAGHHNTAEITVVQLGRVLRGKGLEKAQEREEDKE